MMASQQDIILNTIGTVFSFFKTILFFMMWNRFVPIWKNSRKSNEDGIWYFEKKMVMLSFILIVAINTVRSYFITTDYPVFIISVFAVTVAVVWISDRKWLLETIFSVLFFWNVSSLTYFIADSITDRPFVWLMEGIEKAGDLERFVNVRLIIMQGTLCILYLLFMSVAFVPVARIHREREKIHLQEFAFLSVQNIAGIILTFIMSHLAILTMDGGAFILTEEKPELLWQMPVIAILLYLGELSALYMWHQNISYRNQSEMYMVEKLEKEAMKARLEETQDYYEKIRKVRHDMASHLTNIKGLAEHGYEKELSDYISSLDADIGQIEMSVSTGDPVTDLIINDHMKKADERNVSLNVSMKYGDDWGISAYDIGIVIGNLLDNAIREAALVDDRARDVGFRVVEKPGFIVIICDNPYDVNDITAPSTDEWHGLGLKNIRDMADRYEGGMLIDKRDGRFIAKVMLKKQGR